MEQEGGSPQATPSKSLRPTTNDGATVALAFGIAAYIVLTRSTYSWASVNLSVVTDHLAPWSFPQDWRISAVFYFSVVCRTHPSYVSLSPGRCITTPIFFAFSLPNHHLAPSTSPSSPSSAFSRVSTFGRNKFTSLFFLKKLSTSDLSFETDGSGKEGSLQQGDEVGCEEPQPCWWSSSSIWF